MKRVLKSDEPPTLVSFRKAKPAGTWDELRNDAQHGGKDAYADIRKLSHSNQGGLCAYCEIDIRDDDPLKSRIEHFHPKSDKGPPNWALAWNNMLAVCAGGSFRHGVAPHTMEPLAENLSCDAHKDRLVQQGQLENNCEGWLIDPLLLQAWPPLFEIDKFTGELRASEPNCALAPWPQNKHIDTKSLVERTIEVLNLNCQRLCEARRTVIHDVERNKKRQRELGRTPQQGLALLAQRYFHTRWPGFFTTICLCLGQAADDQIKSIQYSG